MQLVSSHPGLQRWLLPILLAIIVPLLFAALPGEPLHRLAQDAGLVKHVRTEIALLHAVRDGFQQVLQAEPAMPSGHSVRKLTISLDGMAAEGSPESERMAALRDAFEAYAWAATPDVTVERYAEPTTQPLLASVPSHTIGSVLGHLQASDEARLQEPLLAMRLAEAAMRFQRDPRLAEQLSRWAAIFAARLDEMVIPQGTRTNLLEWLAVYEHAALSVHDAVPRQQPGRERSQAAAHTVEAALADADHALTAEQQRLDNAFTVACKGFLWSFIAALGAALLIVGGAMFGRMAQDHGAARSWHAR
jgi:hypothetical protein